MGAREGAGGGARACRCRSLSLGRGSPGGRALGRARSTRRHPHTATRGRLRDPRARRSHRAAHDRGARVPGGGNPGSAGRIDHEEGLEDGLRRELAEETGITHARVVRELSDFECRYETFSRNHAFHVVVEEETPDQWEHVVHGKGADSGLTYLCRWVPLTASLRLWRNEGDPMLQQLPIDG